MKYHNLKKYGSRAAAAGVALLPLSSMAAVDEAVGTAFTTLGTDLATIGTMVIIATVAVAVIKYAQAAIV